MSSLADARHEISNRLADYCAAVDAQDSGAVGRLFADTTLTFRGQQLRGPDPIAEFYAAVFAVAAATQHVVSNLHVASPDHGRAFTYRTIYQRWTLDPSPQCSAVGTYVGSMTWDGDSWRWVSHEVLTHAAPAQQHSRTPVNDTLIQVDTDLRGAPLTQTCAPHSRETTDQSPPSPTKSGLLITDERRNR